jgi:hypothetical protein
MNGGINISAQDLYTQSSVQQHTFGQIGIDKYGDLYRYAKVGGSNISAGKMHTAPTQKTNHHNISAAAAVTADGKVKKVTLTLGATAATANEYAGGILAANDVSPEGEFYRISGHPAGDSSGSLEVTVEQPFKTDISTSSQFTLVHNTWNGSIVNAAFTLPAAGVPAMDMTAAYYGWFKTRGVAAVLIGTAATLGADLICDGSGGVTDRTDALGASAEPVVAVADIVVGVATEYNPVRLVID